VAACGGGGAAESPAAEAPAAEAPAAEAPAEAATEAPAAEEPAAEEAAADIVDTAVAAGSFNTLVAAVTAAELVDALKAEGPFTVFAPSDEAFAALPEGTIDALLADPSGDLTQILLYHVVPGAVLAGDLSEGLTAETLQGGELTFTLEGGAKVNGINIVSTDITASNGVIHVIDGVLLPPADEAAAEEAPAADAPAADASAATTDTAAAEAPAAEAAAAEAPTVRTFAIDPAATEASYFVEEEFFGAAIPFVTAIGKTQTLDGQIAFAVDGATLTDVGGAVNVDLRTLTSDRPRRDSAIRDRWLESNRFPMATFNATGVSDLAADASLGQPVTFKLTGDMTIREVTNPFTWDVTATLDGGTLTGTATSFFLMKDFGFDPPEIATMLKVTDGVSVTVNFTAQEVQ
jgi:uncharacterized surface protein with fasciclin (FAS1) repeats/polyisoprenoid-binding protein YceI